MKFFQFLSRAGFSLLIAFTVSFSLAVIFFNYSGYKTNVDRVFLVLVPTLAIAYLLFETSPTLWKWLGQKLFLFRGNHSIWHYFFGFLLSFFCLRRSGLFERSDQIDLQPYPVYWRLDSGWQCLRILSCTPRRALISRRFFEQAVEHHPLPDVTHLPFCTHLCECAIPFHVYMGLHLCAIQLVRIVSSASALVAGIWGIGALEQFESRGYYQRFRQTIVFKFIKENLPGIYAGGMFFLINLIIARALNHPALISTLSSSNQTRDRGCPFSAAPRETSSTVLCIHWS